MKRMGLYMRFLAVFTALLISNGVFGQGITERSVRGTQRVQTDYSFVYRGIDIPVTDITYHEFSSDSINWSKTYTDGDCYVRFTNEVDNSTDHHPDDSWWVYNFCSGSGSGAGSSNIDTIFVAEGGVIVDTLTSGNVTINRSLPDTLTGSTTNFDDGVTHTHVVRLHLNDLTDVDTTGTQDGYVVKYNAVTGNYEIKPDLVAAGGAGSLTVEEQDGTPSVSNVNTIQISNDHLTNNGAGSVYLDMTLDPVNGVNDYWRTGKVRVGAGSSYITFDTPLPQNDYVVGGLYAILDNGNRQNLNYANTSTDSFQVLSVVDSAYVHYIAIRAVDSLLTTIADIGKVYASPTDGVLGFLSSKTDDSTITVTNEDLTVINSPNADSLGHVVASDYITRPEMVDSINAIQPFDTIAFNQGGVPSFSPYTLFADTANKTLGLYNGDSNVMLQIGEEMWVPICYNNSGAAIANGTPVYIDSVASNAPTIKVASNVTYDESRLIGVATEDIANGSFGRVTRFGYVNDIDLSAFTTGNTIYLGNGVLTNVRPTDGSYPVIVGVAVDATASGRLLVYPQGVEYTAEINEVRGWNSYTQGDKVTLSFNNSSRAIKITPTGSRYHNYQAGIKYDYTAADSLVISNTEGMHTVYYDEGVLSELVNPTRSQLEMLFKNYTTVASVYWDATDLQQLSFVNDMHTIFMSGATQSYLHSTRWVQYVDGFTPTNVVIGDGSLNTHAQFGVDAGELLNEDIKYAPSAVTSTTGLPIYYRSGATPVWRRTTNSGYSFTVNGGTGLAEYNLNTAGTWSLASHTNNYYGLVHVFATGDLGSNKVVAFMGIGDYASETAAESAVDTEVQSILGDNFPFAEAKHLYTFIYLTKTSFSNSVNTAYQATTDGDDYLDYRNVVNTPAGGSSSATTSLLGLNDTPSSYAGHSGGILKVNSAEDGTEFSSAVLDDTGSLTTDSVFAHHFGGASNFTIGKSGEYATFTGDSLLSNSTASISSGSSAIVRADSIDSYVQRGYGTLRSALGDSTAQILDGTKTFTDFISKGPVVDVRAFGVVGDGVTDDTDSLNAIFANSANSTILIPNGNYLIGSTLNINRSDIKIISSPSFTTGAKITYTGTGAALSIGDGTTEVYRIKIDGLRIVASGSATSSSSAIGIRLRNARYCNLDDVTIQGFSAGTGFSDVSSGASFGSSNNYINPVASDCFFPFYIDANHISLDGGFLGSSGGTGSIGLNIGTNAGSSRIFGTDIESAETGILNEGDRTSLISPRLEFNTSVNIYISSNSDRCSILYPEFYGSITQITDNGTNTSWVNPTNIYGSDDNIKTGSILLGNDNYIRSLNSGGAPLNTIGLGVDDNWYVGDGGWNGKIQLLNNVGSLELQINGNVRASSQLWATDNINTVSGSYLLNDTTLLQDPLKNHRLGATGTFLGGNGATSQATWKTLSSSDLSDGSNIAKLDAASHNFTGTGDHTFAGKVGIGTTSPEGDLHVYGVNPKFFVEDSQSGGQWVRFGAGTVASSMKFSNTGYFVIGPVATKDNTDGINNFVVGSNGNVGIGTTSPSSKLDVNGTISKEGTSLLLDAHKSGSLGTAGQFYVGNGATSTPVWTSPSSINLSSFNNDLSYQVDSIPFSDDTLKLYQNGGITPLKAYIPSSAGSGAASSISNDTTIYISGTTPTWNTNTALNAAMTSSGATTITMSNLSDGKSGVLRFTNGGGDGVAFTTTGLTQVFLGGETSTSNIDTTAGAVTIVTYKVSKDTILFASSKKPLEYTVVLSLSGVGVDLAAGTKKAIFSWPTAITIVKVRAIVDKDNPPTGSGITIDLNEDGTTMMSTNKLTIDATEWDSDNAATPPGLTDTSIAAHAQLSADIDAVGSTTAGQTGQVYITFKEQ